jgi:hypothetical protein
MTENDNIVTMSGDKYLTADELLKSCIGSCDAVMIVTVSGKMKTNTYVSTGFTNESAVYAVRRLAFDVEHTVFGDEEI